MKSYKLCFTSYLTMILLTISSLVAAGKPLPEEMQKIMNQSKYEHSFWGIYVKDLNSGEILFDLNSEKLFSPASTTKLFSIAALLNAFGEEYRFKTPVFTTQKIEKGKLQGNLILVASGDLTFGGRQVNPNTIAFTKLDHINANEVPGVILTKEDPLYGINEIAKQIHQNGLREMSGDVLIDDTLFDTTAKRGMVLSPIMINENLIDIVINPVQIGQIAELTWRPKVPGYSVDNQVKTVAKEGELAIEISADPFGRKITVHGTIPLGQKDIVRTFPIQDPKFFARAALIQALENQGIKINLSAEPSSHLQKENSYQNLEQVALWTSPPLSEYAKLVLKVSHNLGADLVPLLLASHAGKKTFDEGMKLLGNFVKNDVKVSSDVFVFNDAAGGNENRLTPQAEVQLLEFMQKQPSAKFQYYFDALPLLGVDGSLEDFAKTTSAVGKVRAKPGTGVSSNLATGSYFLITQALAGYIEGKNGHLFAYVIVVNNAKMPLINDVFAIFEDQSQLSSLIYNFSGTNE